jgi:hypothetical protein
MFSVVSCRPFLWLLQWVSVQGHSFGQLLQGANCTFGLYTAAAVTIGTTWYKLKTHDTS